MHARIYERQARRVLASLIALVLLAAACGGSDDNSDDAGADETTTTTTGATTTTAAAETTTTTEATNAVTDLEGVQSATVQIVAEGSFRDPEVGLQLNVAGSGSGFILDESGIAVTNNHVVTGSAFLEVFVGGSDEPQNARVLGVSECSDLAVIDIDGDGFPFLEWAEGDLSVGTDVYAAGFPLGDPEFTLTRGIISKASADGETSWASVDAVLEHDATINPGNSGGPLVTEDGRVVGINYAGSNATDQYFAISRDEATDVIERLRSGSDVTSLGINGEAVASDADGIYGIWVASVESGSPADGVGIQAGDIITRLEGLVLSTDGTMADYCDILRSNTAEDVLAVEVLRFDTGEVLEGRLNGEPLETSFSFFQEVGNEVVDEGGAVGDTYDEYVTVTDDSGVIQVDVPAVWAERDGRPIENFGPSITAAPSVAGFYDTWETPGVEVSASTRFSSADIGSILTDLSYAGQCDEEFPVEPYDDSLYVGEFQVFDGCGGLDTAILTVVAAPEDDSFIIVVTVQVTSDADVAAIDRILETFVVVAEF